MPAHDNSIPPRAVRTTGAARYLGVSPSLVRKLRLRGADDPLGPGPKFIRISPSLVVYEISALDEWLDQRNEAMQRGRVISAGTRRE